MSVGDLVVDSVGRCGLVVRSEVRRKYRVSYLVLFSNRRTWCSKWEFRVLDS